MTHNHRHLLSVALALAALARSRVGLPVVGVRTQERTMRNQIRVFLRSTGHDEPAEALAAVKSLGLDLVQISKLPDRFYTPEGTQNSPD